jgi:hypothetical protein
VNAKNAWLQNDPKGVRFDMKSCFYFDTFSKYGAPELTASFCQVDDLAYGNMSPYIKWQRSGAQLIATFVFHLRI